MYMIIFKFHKDKLKIAWKIKVQRQKYLISTLIFGIPTFFLFYRKNIDNNSKANS